MNLSSKAFTHFTKYCPGLEEYPLKSLRKTYITKMHMLYGDIARLFTHGASGDVIEKHYFDLMEILEDIRGKKLYDNV